MIQFKVKRAALVLRWTLAQHGRWYLRTTLGWLLMLLALFCLYSTMESRDAEIPPMFMHVLMTYAVFLAVLVMGPSIFPGQKRKNEDMSVMLLPASNAEKYAVRCLSWLLLLPCVVVSFCGADLLQYVVQVVALRSEHPMLVAQAFSAAMLGSELPPLNTYFLLTVLWLNSYFALGGSIVRVHKAAWMISAVALVVVLQLLELVLPYHHVMVLWHGYEPVLTWLFPLLAVVNYWLSYRFYCRTQAIGKLFNW